MNKREMAKQEKKDRIFAYVEDFISVNRRSPSTQEIADGTGIGKTTVWTYLNEMAGDDLVVYDGKTVETKKSHEVSMQQVAVPLVGVIPCGTPEEQEEQIEAYFPLPRALLGPGEFFMLQGSGDSMVDAGINDGDIVVLRRTTEASPGDIVAALTDHESTLKTLRFDDRKKRYYLHPENQAKGYRDIYPETLSVQGVAVKIIKDIP